jgi:hypothetical protein
VPSRLLGRIFPFVGLERGMADERMQAAVRVVVERHPELAGEGAAWFGGRLEGDTRGRYQAVGRMDAGGRGFVVDVVTGHVVRELALGRTTDLPRDIGRLV